MSNKPLNISESAAVQMPMKTVASLIILVSMGVFAYTEITARLTSLETSRELFQADLLKKSEQLPTCLLYTSPSPRDGLLSRMPSSA